MSADELSPEAEAFARAHAERGEQIEAGWRRADAYARSWAQWLAARASREAMPAHLVEQGGAIGLPRVAPAPPPPIAPPAPESAAQGGLRATGGKGEYARHSGDPGAASDYRPDWLPETDLGRRR